MILKKWGKSDVPEGYDIVGEAKLKAGYVKCPKCNQQFSDIRYAYDHLKEEHSSNESEWDDMSKDEKKTKLDDSGFTKFKDYNADKDYNELHPMIKYELKKGEEKAPCWDGYKQVGMKEKNGKKVPNCVPVSNECGCKNSAQEANINKYKSYVSSQIDTLKKKAKANEAVSLMYGLPTVQKNGRKIKGTLAYAGVSLNDRIYLPEELAKGDGRTLPLLLNHSSTAGAENELWRLQDDMLQALQNEEDYEVGYVTLTWDAKKLTLFYEGVVTHPFFQKEIDDANMAVSLGIYYDSNSPTVCEIGRAHV